MGEEEEYEQLPEPTEVICKHILNTRGINFTARSGLGCLLHRNFIKHGDRIAQIYANTGVEDSFESLLEQCRKLASYLSLRNVNRDSLIAISCRKNAYSCIPLLSGLFLGAKVLMINTGFKKAHIWDLVDKHRPSVIFVDDKNSSIFEEMPDFETEIVVFGNSVKHTQFSDLLDNEVDYVIEPVRAQDIDDIALICYTAGITGYPKETSLSHYSLITQIYYIINSGMNIRVNMCFGNYTWLCSTLLLLASFISGNVHVINDYFYTNDFIEYLDKHQVTFVLLLTSEALSLLVYKSEVYIFDLREMLITGSAISEDDILQLRKMFSATRVFQCYTITEAGGFVSLFDLKDPNEIMLLHNSPCSCGKPLDGFTYKVIDPRTKECLDKTHNGRLLIKSRCISTQHSEQDGPFEGWLDTKDIVCYDADKCFYVVRRSEDIIRFRGFDVAPAFLESVLLTHPEVKDALVVGIPDDDDVTHPFALVVKESEERHVSPLSIVRYVDERVEDHERLRRGLKFVNHIPDIEPSVRRDVVGKMVLGRQI